MLKKKSFKDYSKNVLADNEALMMYTRQLQGRKEKLEKRLQFLNEGCDSKQAVLCSSSSSEIASILEEFYPEKPLSKAPSVLDKESFQSYVDARSKNVANSFLGVIARHSDKGNTIVEFTPPENYTSTEPAFLTFEGTEESAKLQHYLLPPVVPVAKLKEQHLSENNRDVAAFIFMIQKHLWCYWMRDRELMNLKTAEYMKNSTLYHNRDRTLVTISFELLSKYNVEMCLKYESLNTLPYEVTYKETENQKLPEPAEIGLNEIRESLLAYPLSIVLKQNLADSVTGDLSHKNSDTSSTEVFELFGKNMHRS